MGEEVPPPREWRGEDDDAFLVWVRGRDYVGQWAEAETAVSLFLRALEDAGVDVDGIRLAASTDEEGAGVARGCCSASSLREVTRLVRLGAGLPAEGESRGERKCWYLRWAGGRR